MPDRECPRCGRVQPATAAGDKCLFCGADLPPVPAEARVVAESPAGQPPAPAATEEALPNDEPGKRPCPHCGELLYESEQRCWRCGQELTPATATPPPAGPPPPEPLAPPPQTDLPATTPVPPPPYHPPAGATPALDPQAQTLAVWSLAIGILGLFTCLGTISPVAIYLGVKANRAGTNTLGTVGIVLGIIGTIVLVILVGLWTLGRMVTHGLLPETPHGPSILLLLSAWRALLSTGWRS